MSIRPPALDDRNFQDLRDEILARIPAHTPEWTNPRIGDPGLTIVELFAWLADTILYRANLVPERQRLVFLRLLGIQTRPARPADGIVTLSLDDDEQTGAVVIEPQAHLKGPADFETRSELTVLPVSSQAFYKRKLNDEQQQALGPGLLEGLQTIYEVDGIQPYVTTPVFANGPEAAGFDLGSQTVDRCLWLALLAADENQVEPVRETLGAGATGGRQIISIGIEPAIAVPELFEDIGPRAKVPFLWEITGVRDRDGRQETEYHRLELLEDLDTTRGLTTRGVQRLVLPAARFIGAPTNDVRNEPRAGVGDSPPRIDAPNLAARLVAWLRLRPEPTPGSAALPPQLSLNWVGINAVEIDARQTIRARVVGQSDGSADQQFQLPGRSIETETLELQVESAGQGFQTWRQIEDLALAARDQHVYHLDADDGVVTFGNGVRGRIPPAGQRLRVARMRSGGGRAGNLPAGTLKQIAAKKLDGADVKLKLAQPLPTRGGEDSESLSDAERRIPDELRHRHRAVTEDDYRRLALDTPGVRLGRVELLPRFKPHQRRFDVPGVVSVMVLPENQTMQPPNPRPDRPLLENVHNYLDQRRPLGTEMYVIGCEYVPIGVSIAVTIRDGFGREEVMRNIRQAVRLQLWPLRPGGPFGQGWPLAKTVRDREIEVAVARVPGVAGLIDPGVNLFERAAKGDDQPDEWRMVPRANQHAPADVELTAWQLPELLSVVVVTDQPPPEDLRGIPNPFVSETAVAVPVVPEVC